MTWSYGADPSNNPVDAVRVTIGDTVGTPASLQLLSNEEIQYFLDANDGDVLTASAAAARAIAAQAARLVDEVTGDLQRKMSQRYRQFSDLADKLTDDASDPTRNNPIPFAGGVSIGDIRRRDSDEDRYPDIFQLGETDDRQPGSFGVSTLS